MYFKKIKNLYLNICIKHNLNFLSNTCQDGADFGLLVGKTEMGANALNKLINTTT